MSGQCKLFILTSLILLAGCEHQDSISYLKADTANVNDTVGPLPQDLVLDGVKYNLGELVGEGTMGRIYRVTSVNPAQSSQWVVKVPFINDISREKNETEFLQRSATQLRSDVRLHNGLNQAGISEVQAKYSDNNAVLFKTFVEGLEDYGDFLFDSSQAVPDGYAEALGKLIGGLSLNKLRVNDLTPENMVFVQGSKKLEIIDGGLSKAFFKNSQTALDHYLANFKYALFNLNDEQAFAFLKQLNMFLERFETREDDLRGVYNRIQKLYESEFDKPDSLFLKNCL